MNTRTLVDPELQSALDTLPNFDINGDTLSAVRLAMEEMLLPEEEYAHPEISIERLTIPGPDGNSELGIILFKPKNQSKDMPAILHIHGGGFVLGSAEISNASNVKTALEVGCVIASVDYRLAPETKAPGAVEDCYAGLKWLHENANQLGLDRGRIAVAGESAGGGLAANLAQFARDKGEYDVCFQLLIYPMLDDRTVTNADLNPTVGEFVWTKDANAFGWRSLLGGDPGGATVPPYSAASRAADLSNLPPAYIYVGALDLFLEEDVDYAMRMLAAGVSVELHVLPGAFHGFELVPTSTLAMRAEKERIEVLKRAFNSASKD